MPNSDTIREQTLQICKSNGIKPQKSKGQNFLIEERYYDQIIEAAELNKTDKVLEVGPGLGFLTARLAQKAGVVTAVELDDKLADLLRIDLKKKKIANVQVMNGNALDLQVGSQNAKRVMYNEENNNNEANTRYTIHDTRYKIVANLPYNITSAFLRKFLSQARQKPESLVLLLQKEVAERICAGPGAMSLLAVSVQAYATAEIIGFVPAKAFYPPPEVESAIIRIRVRDDSVIPTEARRNGGISSRLDRKKEGPIDSINATFGVTNEKEFFQLVRIGFSARRKKLANNLSAGFLITQAEATAWLARAGFGENARAQELSVDDWIRLLRLKS